MSLTRKQTFFDLYGRNSYMHKINPQFEGIAKRYYNQKREHEKVHRMKNKLDKDVAYVERIEKNIQNSLHKKRRELQYTKQVNNRLMNDIRRKERIQEFNQKTSLANQQNARLLKTETERRLKDAKMYLSEHKRSMGDISRSADKQLKEKKTINRAKEWDSNRSRVSQIEQFKKNTIEKTNHFYQKRNSQSLSRLQDRINSYKRFQDYDNENIKKLQSRKNRLNSRCEREKTECDQLDKQIERVKQQTKLENSLVRSRLRSRQSSASGSSVKELGSYRHRSEMVHPEHI